MLRGLAIIAGGAVWPAGGSRGTGQLQGIEGARCGSLVARSRRRLGRGDHPRCARSALWRLPTLALLGEDALCRDGGIGPVRRLVAAALHWRQSTADRAANGTCAAHGAVKRYDLVALGSSGRGNRADFAVWSCCGPCRTLSDVRQPSVGSESGCARCSGSETCLYYR